MVSIRKILQILFYIQNKSDNQARFNIMYLLKIIYFADRYHLRHFGFLFTGDEYYAMRKGPVASAVKDVLYQKIPFGANSSEYDLLSCVDDISEFERKITKQEQDELSESFIESLDFAIFEFGKMTPDEISDFSHNYPDWKKHEKEVINGGRSKMLLLDFFDNPKNLKKSEDPFQQQDTESLEAIKEDFADNENSCR